MNDESQARELTGTGPIDYQPSGGEPLGRVLRRANIISDDQSVEIEAHATRTGMRYGEAAVALGIIDRDTLTRALATQFDMRVPDGQGGSGEPVAFTMPYSDAAEDYRSIRNALALRWFKHPQGARTLAVVSPQRGDGRSVMAANLAVCCAQVGFRTLLIDGDMRRPSQHRLFALDDRFGLSNFLAGHHEGRVFDEVPGIPSLSVMPAGGLPPNPQELLLRQRLNQLVGLATDQFEMVIFDTPAAELGSDYQIIGAEAQGALIVTHRERTRTRSAKRLVDACRGFGIRIVGSAMTSMR